MSDTKLDYGAMMERARHGVARQALELVRDHGLPGGHHFYITFRTGDPGVEIDDFLQRRFPDEMTIILQHQYWDLAVDGHGFSVVLSFDDRSAKLTVPYTALAAFVDPSVGFILQFGPESEKQAGEKQAGETQVGEKSGGQPKPVVIATIGDRSRDKSAGEVPPPADATPKSEGKPGSAAAPGTDPGSADVVALDQFRKKT